jgi:protein-tyrosine phosphatase
MNYICLPILDTGIPSIDEFDKALNKVTNEMTYIHCAQGHGRTTIFTIALLVRIGKVRNFEEAFDLLKKSRPGIHLNTRQRMFVQEYLPKKPCLTRHQINSQVGWAIWCNGNPRNMMPLH